MSMFYIFLVVILFAGEIYLSIQIGEAIGALRTILLMAGIAVAGLFWIKLEANALSRRFEAEFKANTSMTDTAVELVLIVAAAILFVLPGFFTDILAVLFVLPPTRAYFATRFPPGFRRKIEETVEKKRQELLARRK